MAGDYGQQQFDAGDLRLRHTAQGKDQVDLNIVKYLLHTVFKHGAVIRGRSETEEQHIKIIVTNLGWLRVFRTLCRTIRYRLTKCLAYAYLHAQQDMIISWER